MVSAMAQIPNRNPSIAVIPVKIPPPQVPRAPVNQPTPRSPGVGLDPEATAVLQALGHPERQIRFR